MIQQADALKATSLCLWIVGMGLVASKNFEIGVLFLLNAIYLMCGAGAEGRSEGE